MFVIFFIITYSDKLSSSWTLVSPLHLTPPWSPPSRLDIRETIVGSVESPHPFPQSVTDHQVHLTCLSLEQLPLPPRMSSRLLQLNLPAPPPERLLPPAPPLPLPAAASPPHLPLLPPVAIMPVALPTCWGSRRGYHLSTRLCCFQWRAHQRLSQHAEGRRCGHRLPRTYWQQASSCRSLRKPRVSPPLVPPQFLPPTIFQPAIAA